MRDQIAFCGCVISCYIHSFCHLTCPPAMAAAKDMETAWLVRRCKTSARSRGVSLPPCGLHVLVDPVAPAQFDENRVPAAAADGQSDADRDLRFDTTNFAHVFVANPGFTDVLDSAEHFSSMACAHGDFDPSICWSRALEALHPILSRCCWTTMPTTKSLRCGAHQEPLRIEEVQSRKPQPQVSEGACDAEVTIQGAVARREAALEIT